MRVKVPAALLVGLLLCGAASIPLGAPSVTTGDGTTWVGKASLVNMVDSFLGMPFAEPPVG